MSSVPFNPTGQPQRGGLGVIPSSLLERFGPELMGLLITFLTGLVARKRAPEVDPETPPAPPVVVAPATPTAPPVVVPQVPVKPSFDHHVTRVRLAFQGMEKPTRVGGGPGVNYEDHLGMVASNSAFNYGSVGFFDATAFDQEGTEFSGGRDGLLSQCDLEYRNEYRVYDNKSGELVAFIKGEGDDNPAGEGQARPYHKSDNSRVHFGESKWHASVGMGVRITFEAEGEWRVVQLTDGVESNAWVIRTS